MGSFCRLFEALVMTSHDLDGGLRGGKDGAQAVLWIGRRRGGELGRDRENQQRSDERAEPDCRTGGHFG
jgi:hypothetical protein